MKFSKKVSHFLFIGCIFFCSILHGSIPHLVNAELHLQNMDGTKEKICLHDIEAITRNKLKNCNDIHVYIDDEIRIKQVRNSFDLIKRAIFSQDEDWGFIEGGKKSLIQKDFLTGYPCYKEKILLINCRSKSYEITEINKSKFQLCLDDKIIQSLNLDTGIEDYTNSMLKTSSNLNPLKVDQELSRLIRLHENSNLSFDNDYIKERVKTYIEFRKRNIKYSTPKKAVQVTSFKRFLKFVF